MRSLHNCPLRRTAFTVVLACFTALGAPLSAAGDSPPATTIRARINSDILGTDPAGRRDENTDAVLLHIVEGLVAYRENASIGPLLARDWRVSEDGRVYLFRLREDVRFHNGEKLTAADVVWSFNRYLDPATRWRCLPDLDGRRGARIVSVKEVDAVTVEIAFDRPFPLFLKTIARPDCGATAILHRDSVTSAGRWRKPVGTGPYELSTWHRNQSVHLARFGLYSALPGPRDGNTGGKRAHADTVVFVVIPDPSAAQAALFSGAIDVFDGAPSNMYRSFRHRDGVKVGVHATMDSYALLLQTADPLLQDVRLRRAIAHTIDVPALAQAASQGLATANASVVPASSPFYTSAQRALRRVDLRAARSLAAASGYRGEPITLITNRRYPEMFDAAILVQAMARKAGIHFKIEVVDWATELDRYQRGAYQAMVFAYSARLDPSFSYGALIGSKAMEPRKVWDDPVAAQLLAASMTTEDATSRQAAFDDLHARFLDQVPAVVLYNSQHVSAARANVSGFAGWAAVQQRLWGVRID